MSTMTDRQLQEILAKANGEEGQMVIGSVSVKVAVTAMRAALDAHLTHQSEVVSEESQLERWGKAPEGSPYLLQPMADGYWTPWHIAQAALTAVWCSHEEMLPPGLYTWLAERDLIPDLDEEGSFYWGDLITALNDHEASLMESKSAQEKAEPMADVVTHNGLTYGKLRCDMPDGTVLYTAPPTERVRVPDGWQPIETAPKDGTRILLTNGHGVWMGEYLAFYTSGERADRWISTMLNHDHIEKRSHRYTNPTSWQPIPAAPEASHD